MTGREWTVRIKKVSLTDDRLRVWDLSDPSSKADILPAKAISCIAHDPTEEVLVTGAHDTGRIQIWHKDLPSGHWRIANTLLGHRHGIRAIT